MCDSQNRIRELIEPLLAGLLLEIWSTVRYLVTSIYQDNDVAWLHACCRNRI